MEKDFKICRANPHVNQNHSAGHPYYSRPYQLKTSLWSSRTQKDKNDFHNIIPFSASLL